MKATASFRQWVHDAINRHDLLLGIQATCKGRFRRFPDYGIDMIWEVFKKTPESSIIIGGREVAKTFHISFGYFLRCITEPDFEVYLVPGQKIDQAKTALKYVDTWTRKSSILKPISGANRKLGLEWTTMTKKFANGSLMHALAPNEGVVSEHGCVWCDEYQSLPESVDEALEGFTGRPGDRKLLSGTANKRASPLHRAYNVALNRYPQNIVTVPVELAYKAGILSRANIEAKRIEHGGKLTPVDFDAWFNCKFPDTGTMGWHPLESALTLGDVSTMNADVLVCKCTGCDPGIPVNRFVMVVRLKNGQMHAIHEFDLDDVSVKNVMDMDLGALAVEFGTAFGGGYNKPFHSILDLYGIPHVDSYVDGDPRSDLFSNAIYEQSQGKLYVNPITCRNLWRACEEQTFDDKNEMDRLPFTHYIFAWLHALYCVRGGVDWSNVKFNPGILAMNI